MIRKNCPKCQKRYHISNKLVGKQIRCQQCNHEFVIKAKNMSKVSIIKVPCPKCHKSYRIADKLSGKKMRCKKCATIFRISPEKIDLPSNQVDAFESSMEASIVMSQTSLAVVDEKSDHLQLPNDVEFPESSTVDAPSKNNEVANIFTELPGICEDMEYSALEISSVNPTVSRIQTSIRVQNEEQNVAQDWKEGDVILDLYKVLQVVGKESFYKVYRVKHLKWDRDVLVKSFRLENLHEEAKINFLCELEPWTKLGIHPHIVGCYYVRTLGDVPTIFLEYQEGTTLRDCIYEAEDFEVPSLYQGGQQKSLAKILDIAIQVAWGLHYAHSQGAIHKNIDPLNIITLKDQTAKISQFGLTASFSKMEIEETFSLENIIIYSSPEQLDNKKISHYSDIWSWGCLLLEMFAGEVFWTDGREAMKAIQDYKTLPIASYIPAMPPKLENLLVQCFAEKPKKRIRDLQSAANILKQIYEESFGEYPRDLPDSKTILADAWNNRAVALLDLGRKEEAEKLLEQALTINPQHLYATYNWGLLFWRTGRLTYEAFIQQLKAAGQENWRVWYYIGSIHTEQGDQEAALSAMAEASQRFQDDANAKKLTSQLLASIKPGYINTKTLSGHEGQILDVAVTRDGETAISSSADHSLRLWDTKTGHCLKMLKGHRDEVEAVVITPDGHMAVSASLDKTLRLWNLQSNKCEQVFEGHAEEVRGVAITPDMRRIVSASADYTLRVWRVSSGRCIHILQDHSEEVEDVALSHDGKIAVSGSMDCSLCVWDINRGDSIFILEGHDGPVKSVSLSKDGKIAVSGSSDTTLRIWDVQTGDCIHTLEGHREEITGVEISEDGKLVVSSSADGCLRVWDVYSGRCLRILKNDNVEVLGVAANHNLELVVSADEDGNIKVWKVTLDLPLSPYVLVDSN